MSIRLYKQALKLWGEGAQVGMLYEELAELMIVVNKRYRNPGLYKRQEVRNELADVTIMCEQMAVILDGNLDGLKNAKTKKLEYLKYLVNRDKKS